jgi:hypothetical protein
MVRTTRAPRFDVAALFPEMAALAKQTVRLHPRPGPEPVVNASKLGGQILWPADEEWPVCTEPEWRREEDTSPPHQHIYIPVLQLRRDEFPELEFPGDADLFQLLWCPNDHEDPFIAPVCKVYWRKEAEVTEPVADMPHPAPVEADYLPQVCCLHPERVVEYPDQGELSDDLGAQLQGWEAKHEEWDTYFSELSTAPGTKLGGHEHWIQSAWVPDCECGHEMEHLLTIASSEIFGREWQRWCPAEDIQATGKTVEQLEADYAYLDALRGVDRSTGIMLGDVGSLYLFVCRQCPEWPIDWITQSH